MAVYGRSDVVARDGDADVIGDPEDPSGPSGLFWRRGVVVPVSTATGDALTVASVHVRPGAVVGGQKLEYVTRLGAWMATAPRPLVLGVDANSPGVDADGSEAFWDVEEAVWGPAATHGLRDTWRSTGRPFSPTHVLKGGKGVRFDHLWISDELEATSHEHLLEEAKLVGSDHALVIAAVKSREGGTAGADARRQGVQLLNVTDLLLLGLPILLLVLGCSRCAGSYALGHRSSACSAGARTAGSARTAATGDAR